jgi:integrase
VTQPTDCSNGLVVYSYIELVECGWSRSAVPPMAHVWAIRVRLQLKHRKRDLALFNLAIDSKLRGCDLVRLQLNDVCAGGRVRDRATVIQKKTGRPVQFEITEQTRAAIQDWLARADARNGDYIFPSRFRAQPHLSTRQ